MHQPILKSLAMIVLAIAFSRMASGQSVEAPLNVAMTAYDLEVSVDFTEGGTDFPFLNLMTGRARIAFTNSGETPLAEVPILLNRLLRVTSARDGAGAELEASAQLVGIKGWEAFQVNYVSVTLVQALAPDASAVLEIEYTGQLANSRATGMAYVQDTIDPAFTIFRAETFAYPVINQPDRTVSSPLNMGGAFRQRIMVNMPIGYDAANGGKRVADETSGGRRRVIFETTTPSALMTFTIAPYEMITVEDARFYHFPEDREGAERLAKAASAAFELLTGWFGERRITPEGVAFIEIPPHYGSQAVLPTIIQDAAAFRSPERMYEMFHEIAHLWNPTELENPSPRWNEGLSTFLQRLIDEQLREEGAYMAGMERTFAGAKRRINDDTICAGIREFGNTQVMRGGSYTLGGLFFSRIYHRYGDRFLQAYGAFYQAHKTSGATTQDLTELLVAELGEGAAAEINTWFDTCNYLDLIKGADNFEAFLAAE